MKVAKQCFWLMLRTLELQNLYVGWVLKWDCRKIEQGLRYGLNPNTKNASDDMTLLCKAIEKRQSAAALILLKGGGNPNAKTTLGNTPLFLAIASGDPQTVTALIEAGADVQYENHMGFSPLGWCIPEYTANQREGNAQMCAQVIECAKVLLAHGADPDRYSRRIDHSPLMMTVYNELPELFVLFLQHGADPFQTNTVDESPASLIQKRNLPAFAKLLPARTTPSI